MNAPQHWVTQSELYARQPPVARQSAMEFMNAVPAAVLSGNTPWAHRYAHEIRGVFHRFAENAPRSLQRFPGPSEIGVRCDRQLAGKLAQLPRTNHVSDPWPSIRGTALHSWAERAFNWDNEQRGLRWLTERRVYPHPHHPGTADLYDSDGDSLSVDDHKFLGPTSMARVRSPEGPPRKWFVQLLLYARGYRLEGFPVKRIVLLAYPATAASLDGLYVWEHQLTPADDEALKLVFQELEYRYQLAIALVSGEKSLMDVPCTVDSEECYFCPFYRPQSAKDGGPGCPGHAGNTE